MASGLRKFAYTGDTSKADTETSKRAKMADMNKLKIEVLTSLKSDIATLIRSELKSVLAEEFSDVKSELQAVKLELSTNTAVLRSDLDKMKTTMNDMEHGLSTCSDDVTALQTTVGKLESAVTSLQEKCLDLEGRMRRSNIRILNIAEGPGSSSPASVSKLLREALHLDKDLVIDRSHRSLQPKHPSGKPRAIIAKLHYYQDCADILRKARETGPLQLNGTPILIFPDYPPSVAQARSAFNDVRKLLRGRDGVRYGMYYPARFRITHHGTEKQFQDSVEAMAYIKANIL